MLTASITFTEAEASAAVKLFDIAVKSAGLEQVDGLNVAIAAINLTQKFNPAIHPQTEPEAEPTAVEESKCE
jgi:hypothetical protein